MKPADASAVQVTLSGRELALMRRQVMALRGKAGVVRQAPTRSDVDVAVRPAMAVSRAPASADAAAPASSASAARLRRQALSQSGKAALQVRANPAAALRSQPVMAAAAKPSPAASCGCGCQGAGDCATATLAPKVGSVASTASTVAALTRSPAPDSSSTRALARARRQALATDGKGGLRQQAQATRIAAAMPVHDRATGMDKASTGRQKAMQRRLAQSRGGSTKATAETRPSGRMRARVEVAPPPAMGEGRAPGGRSVTGMQAQRSKKVTGHEPGSGRSVTGTEFIGAELRGALPVWRVGPGPGTAADDLSQREHKVTGIEVGHCAKVTGDETGACRGITGTEYLGTERLDGMADGRTVPVSARVVELGAARGRSATGAATGHTGRITGDETGACGGITGTEYLSVEQFRAPCGTDAPVSPRKVSVMSSRSQQTVSGTEVGRSSKVTGDEPGSCRSITGSQYYTPESFGALCDTAVASKVAAMKTLAGRTLTGTELGRSAKMTGSDKGGCTAVTGTEYIGPGPQQAECADGSTVQPVAKIVIDHTWRGQPVSGSYVGRSSRVTGDEPGGCAPISGTPYIGRGQYNAFCATPATQAQDARIQSRALIPATAVTGDRPGAGGLQMTGDERGACEVVSGTPYIGADNVARSCATSGRFVSRTSTWVEPPRSPAPVDFSISTPARAAQQRQPGEVSGTGCNSERITGPVNKAGGLITGTPEFRHRDAASSQAAQEAVASAARRLTGEGSQAGRQVTGDAWSAMSKVTGTEGTSSLSRNPSARGNPRGMGMGAAHAREAVARPVVPESRITGSSGSTGRGALVTLSGGARG